MVDKNKNTGLTGFYLYKMCEVLSTITSHFEGIKDLEAHYPDVKMEEFVRVWEKSDLEGLLGEAKAYIKNYRNLQ